jgi:hypothetical protein
VQNLANPANIRVVAWHLKLLSNAAYLRFEQTPAGLWPEPELGRLSCPVDGLPLWQAKGEVDADDRS